MADREREREKGSQIVPDQTRDRDRPVEEDDRGEEKTAPAPTRAPGTGTTRRVCPRVEGDTSSGSAGGEEPATIRIGVGSWLLRLLNSHSGRRRSLNSKSNGSDLTDDTTTEANDILEVRCPDLKSEPGPEDQRKTGGTLTPIQRPSECPRPRAGRGKCWLRVTRPTRAEGGPSIPG